MNRLTRLFATKRSGHLMTFVVAGDPDYQTSLKVIKALEAGGADIIELGLPFSDPVADGPVIQQADQRALASGMNTDRFFDLCREFRKDSETPLVVLTYTNLVLQRNINTFYQDAAEAGVDAVVIADLPYEESGPYIAAADAFGISPVMMVSPTTSTERLSRILTVKSGFLYLVAVLGVTGERTVINQDAVRLLHEIKQKTEIPVAPGFGISDQKQVKEWTNAGADAVIVGSALVRIIGEMNRDTEKMLEALTRFVKTLKN